MRKYEIPTPIPLDPIGIKFSGPITTGELSFAERVRDEIVSCSRAQAEYLRNQNPDTSLLRTRYR